MTDGIPNDDLSSYHNSRNDLSSSSQSFSSPCQDREDKASDGDLIGNEMSNLFSNSDLNELIADKNSPEELKEGEETSYNRAVENLSKEFPAANFNKEQTPNNLSTTEELKEELSEYKRRKQKYYQRDTEVPVILYY